MCRQNPGRDGNMSLRQIAQSLGVSITTVSRALAGYSDVSAATRERVVAEAHRIRYVPNEVARRLQRGRADGIGFIVPGGARGFDDRYFLNMVEGAWWRLAGTEVDLLVLSSDQGPTEALTYRRIVEGGRVDGLLVPRIRESDSRIDYLCEVGFPFIAFGAEPSHPKAYAYVDIDTEAATAEAMRHLADLGHRSVALLSSDEALVFARSREAAFLKAAAGLGITTTILCGKLAEASGFALMSELLARPDRPTAAISITDRIGIGAVRAVREHGLTVGPDMSIITFGDNPVVAFMHPPMTAISIPVQAMTAHAVDYLARRERPDAPLTRLWKTELVVRESTAAPRGRGMASDLPLAV